MMNRMLGYVVKPGQDFGMFYKKVFSEYYELKSRLKKRKC